MPASDPRIVRARPAARGSPGLASGRRGGVRLEPSWVTGSATGRAGETAGMGRPRLTEKPAHLQASMRAGQGLPPQRWPTPVLGPPRAHRHGEDLGPPSGAGRRTLRRWGLGRSCNCGWPYTRVLGAGNGQAAEGTGRRR